MNNKDWVFSRPAKLSILTWFKHIYWVYVISSTLRFSHFLAQCGKKDDWKTLVLALMVSIDFSIELKIQLNVLTLSNGVR